MENVEVLKNFFVSIYSSNLSSYISQIPNLQGLRDKDCVNKVPQHKWKSNLRPHEEPEHRQTQETREDASQGREVIG